MRRYLINAVSNHPKTVNIEDIPSPCLAGCASQAFQANLKKIVVLRLGTAQQQPELMIKESTEYESCTSEDNLATFASEAFFINASSERWICCWNNV